MAIETLLLGVACIICLMFILLPPVQDIIAWIREAA